MSEKNRNGKLKRTARIGGIVLLAGSLGLIILHLALPFGLSTFFLAPEDALEKRARGLMESLMVMDLEAVGGYLQNTEWLKNQPLSSHKLDSYKIREIKIDEDSGTVQVVVNYRLFIPKIPQLSMVDQEIELSQKWKKDRFQWYLQVGEAPTTFFEIFNEETEES